MAEIIDFKEKIKDIDINKEMKESYIEYAMSVIVSRALPDVRDGLKPVQRRIIHAMGEIGLTHDKKYRKSAKIVGDVISKYHPHGDSSIYGAMVRMAQKFSLRYPLVDGQGNFGTVDGDGAAAMRYTEAKMTKLTAEMLKDINKNTVDFRPNFDSEEVEPVILPSRFPNLLVNGANGIAVGMATNIPPHNLGEIINAIVALIDNKDIEIDELIEYVKGPDFPTGATIMGMSGFKRGYKTGKGRVIIRSNHHIEENKNGKLSIVVTEIPYQVNKARLLGQIADLVRDKKVDGITGLRDESNREGIRIVIELRRDVTPQVLLNQLFKHTQLQTSFSMNTIALVGGEPKLLNLKECLYYYLEHQKDVETRRIKFDLDKALARIHILEGLVIGIDNIDEVIRIIRNAYNDAEEKLMERFQLSEIQAKAICDMQIRRLQGLEREKIEDEINKLTILIAELKSLLEDESKLLNLIKTNLLEVKEKNSDDRRTQIEYNYEELDVEDLIDQKQVTITLTHYGYVKRVETDIYDAQRRGGRGKTALSTKEEDFVIDIFNASTHDTLLIFTNFGKVYALKAYQIPEGSRTSRGNAIVNLIPIEQDERVKTVLPISEFDDGYLIMLTKKGLIKKTSIREYSNIRKTGVIAMNLQEDDELVGTCITNGKNELIIVTANGQSIRLSERTIRATSRNTMGVKGISLRKEDYVVALCKLESTENTFVDTSEDIEEDDITVIDEVENDDIETIDGEILSENDESEYHLLVISENGFAKRTRLSEYKTQNRGGIGTKTYRITPKTGKLIGASVVRADEDLILINSKGVVIRIQVNTISIIGRVSSGVMLMKLEDDDYIVSFARIKDSEDDDSNESEDELDDNSFVENSTDEYVDNSSETEDI